MKIKLMTVIFLGIYSMAFAAGSTVSISRFYDRADDKGRTNRPNYTIYDVDIVASGSDGNITSTDLDTLADGGTFTLQGLVTDVEVNPGATVPTDNFSIVLLNSMGNDIMGGELADCDNVTSTQSRPFDGYSFGPKYVFDGLTLTPTGNSIPSATMKIRITTED